MAGVAISDSLAGPFRFLGRYRLSQCPKGQIDCFPSSKGEARDMNLFKDDDGIAYIAYTSENNKTMYISKLNEEYTYLSADPEEAVYKEDFIRLFPGSMREAPVLFKGDNGRYYFMSSSTTGWMSNQARVWSADEIFGEWKTTETLAWEKMETLPLTPRAPAFSRRNPVSGFTSETAGTARIWQIPDTSGCLLLSTAIR